MSAFIATPDLQARTSWLASARRRLRDGWVRPQADTRAADIEALLARASRYEPTQPGYAADLREAARALQRGR